MMSETEEIFKGKPRIKELIKQQKEKDGKGYKPQKWKTICIETKNHPDEPKSLITGELKGFFGNGDVTFSKVTEILLWNTEKNSFIESTIPAPYLKAKQITFSHSIIASVIYLEEKEVKNDVTGLE